MKYSVNENGYYEFLLLQSKMVHLLTFVVTRLYCNYIIIKYYYINSVSTYMGLNIYMRMPTNWALLPIHAAQILGVQCAKGHL